MRKKTGFGYLWLLFFLLLAWPAWADDCEVNSQPCEEDGFEMHVLAHIGYAHPGLQALNSQLLKQEYSALNENMFLGGGAMQIVVNNFLSELEFDALINPPTVNSDFQTWMGAGDFLLNFGYVLKPTTDLSLYPVLGVGLGFVDLSFSRRNLFLSFDEFLSNPGQQGRITNLMLILNAGLNLDYTLHIAPHFGLKLGVRGGYLWTPIASNWWQLNDVLRSDEDNQRSVALADGPAIGLSGPYLKLVVGF